MHKLVILVSLVLVVSSCKKGAGGHADSDAASAAQASADAPAPAPGGQYELTAAKLDAFIRYQRKMAPVYAQARAEERALAHASPIEATAKLMESQRRSTLAEQAIRDELRLSSEDVKAIQDGASSVLLARTLSAIPHAAQIKQMEASRDASPADQRARWDELIGARKQQLQELESLTAQRQAFGTKNVDLLLTREADLKKNQDDQMAALAGKK